jgi:hypothetical protein
MRKWATMDNSQRSGRLLGQPGPAGWAGDETWQSNVVDRQGSRAPSAAALVAASLWALASAIVSAAVAAAALITVAGDPPTWYQPSMLAIGSVSLAATIGGLWLAGIARLRWKLLAIGTAAIIVAALLTVAALAGIA